MKAENSLNSIRSYRNGWNEVCEHKSLSSTLIGLLKLLSYVLIFPPLIANCLYLKSKKIVELQKEIDTKIDTFEIQQLFNETLGKKTGQEQLIDYLVTKLANFEETDGLDKERARFEKGFKGLSFESQGEFFKKVSASKSMQKALEWLPEDIKELNFVSGPPNALSDSEINGEHINLLLKVLPRFTKLEKIELNLRGLGFYTHSVNGDIKAMAETPGKIFICSGIDRQRTFEVRGTRYNHVNEPMPITCTLNALKGLVQSNPSLDWAISLMNFHAAGVGKEIRREGNGEIGFHSNLRAFLAKD